MKKFKMGNYDFLYEKNYLRLSTGAIADMKTNTIEDAFKAFDNLTSMIVMEHFKEILKTSTEDQNYDQAVEMVKNEVKHLVKNELSENYEAALTWVLTTLALERMNFFINKVIEEQNKKES
ncbi:hypothetical protein [Desulfobacter sp.]|uniref:hypothetical protein n=1 Tax=Desulfobacter sp. TaxID=2294 RepID=UPI000E89E9DB|nr:hypothetical protein [Desulfobacter sp.]HBT88329.1 hypothetical protein [Desulfobacter sp.]